MKLGPVVAAAAVAAAHPMRKGLRQVRVPVVCVDLHNEQQPPFVVWWPACAGAK